MRLSLRYLLDRVTQPASRLASVGRVRDRLKDAHRSVATDEERALALRMREGRRAVLEQIGEVEACTSCASRRAMPGETSDPRWGGGHCCGGDCDSLFTPEEVASLAAAGTRARALRLPPARVEHRGCAFRDHRGCTLTVDHRPNICLRYTCKDLRRELSERGDWAAVQARVEALERDFAAFTALRREREEREDLERWTRALTGRG